MPTSLENTPSLPRGQVHHALKSFVTASGLWGAWGQACGLGTAAFTGFALHLGADESFIALFTSAAYFLALTQLLAPFLSTHIRDKKRFVIGAGCMEIILRGLPLTIPFLVPEPYRLIALVAMVCLSLFSGYSISPFYSTWIANTVPENIRARFSSRQTIVSTIVAMVAGFAIGQFLDLFPTGDKERGFVWVFAIGSLFGLLGYLNLYRAPFPQHRTSTDEQGAGLRDLLHPLRDPNFRRAALFYGLWTFSLGLAGPLYSVFMLDELVTVYVADRSRNRPERIGPASLEEFRIGEASRMGSRGDTGRAENRDERRGVENNCPPVGQFGGNPPLRIDSGQFEYGRKQVRRIDENVTLSSNVRANTSTGHHQWHVDPAFIGRALCAYRNTWIGHGFLDRSVVSHEDHRGACEGSAREFVVEQSPDLAIHRFDHRLITRSQVVRLLERRRIPTRERRRCILYDMTL